MQWYYECKKRLRQEEKERFYADSFPHRINSAIEFEQGGAPKAIYGSSLLVNLSKDLTALHSKGFSRSNLNYMRLLYSCYPICEELPHKLSWTHFCELVKIDAPLERSFYEKQAINESWSTTELKRPKNHPSSYVLPLPKTKSSPSNWPNKDSSYKNPATSYGNPIYSNSSRYPNRTTPPKQNWKNVSLSTSNISCWNWEKASLSLAGSTGNPVPPTPIWHPKHSITFCPSQISSHWPKVFPDGVPTQKKRCSLSNWHWKRREWN